jgi:7-carboxy-7-deazaguanine synthase
MKICEIFRSLQGEGTLIGTPTVFVRTSGCNLECAWCDTPYSKKDGDELTVTEILDKVKAFEIHYVCVTGGEPLFQTESVRLIDELLKAGYHVSIETNGSISLEDLPCSMNMLISMDIKCPSSGMADQMDLTNRPAEVRGGEPGRYDVCCQDLEGAQSGLHCHLHTGRGTGIGASC